MTSEVEENSAPTTPTLSSVAPSDISLDDLQPLTDASSQVSDDELEMHPTLFIREDMVSIRVQRTLFRIPSFYLSHDSRYFSQLFSKHTHDQTVCIGDADVNSSGFANLLRIIRPPLGTNPLSTLVEWTDVLHLSSKWGFADLPTASLAAIPPLASPVDKLVLARTYSLTDWISPTYVDLLEREDDLTEEEAERMTIKDIVAIAKGRRVVRASGKVGPRSEVEKVAEGLLPAAKKNTKSTLLSTPSSSTTTPGHVAPLPMKVTPAAMVQTSDESRLLLSRWLDQLQSNSPSLVQSAETCLVRYLQADLPRVSLVLDVVLGRSFVVFQANYVKLLTIYRICDVRPSDCDIGRWDIHLYTLNQRCMGLGIHHSTHTREAGLRFINQWSGVTLICQNSTQKLEGITSSQEWQDLLNGAMFLSRCCIAHSGHKSLINPSVFEGFWAAMRTSFTTSTPHHTLSMARLQHTLLDQLKERHVNDIRCDEVYWEMDAFYRAVEEARSQAQKDVDFVDQVKVVEALDALIKQRVS